MALHVQGQSNLSDYHNAKGDVSAIQLELADTAFYPRDIHLETLLTPDTTFALLSAGDLFFHLESQESLEGLIEKGTLLADSASQQMQAHRFDRNLLTSMLPAADLCIQSGQSNPLSNVLAKLSGISYQELDVDLHTHPVTGLQGDGHLYTTHTGAVILDTLTFKLYQDTVATYLDARVCNGKKNKDVTFDSRLHASVNPDSVSLAFLFFDEQRRKGVDLGAALAFRPEGLRVHLTPYHQCGRGTDYLLAQMVNK